MRRGYVPAIALAIASGGPVAGGTVAGGQPSVPVVRLDLPSASGADLAPAAPVYAPVVGANGASMVGPDGRDRCVAIAPPPAALAAQPDPRLPDPPAYDGIQDFNGSAGSGGAHVSVPARVLTYAETVPCP